jgi:hypothetical protein
MLFFGVEVLIRWKLLTKYTVGKYYYHGNYIGTDSGIISNYYVFVQVFLVFVQAPSNLVIMYFSMMHNLAVFNSMKFVEFGKQKTWQ